LYRIQNKRFQHANRSKSSTNSATWRPEPLRPNGIQSAIPAAAPAHADY
jgi:hypothetical protein